MLEADLLIDRRRLKRRLTLWRVVAVLAVLGLVALAVLPRTGVTTHHLARIKITGVITEDDQLDRAIRRLADDAAVPAVILSIDSPGGSVAGGESLYGAIASVARTKPVVTVMHGTAASAGYMIAMPTQRIFASGSTLTGSIGVILETVEASGLLHTLGIDAQAITSGPLKDQPSFTRPLTPEGRAYLDALVQDMYDQFVDKVALGRHMDPATVRKLADGRAYTGRQALALGLVDQLGTETDARSWLEQQGVPRSLPVQDLEPRSFVERTFGSALTSLRLALPGPVGTGAWAIWDGR